MAKVKNVPHQCSELGKTAAGVPSVKQSLSQEPSFTRKRRVGGGGGSEMARESVLTQVKEETKSTKAPSFRVGHPRPHPLPAPSEYQVQFSWKSGPDAPLLQAEERLRRNEGAEGKIENGGGGTTKMRNASTVETKSNGVTSSHKKEQPKINGTQGGDARSHTKGPKPLEFDDKQKTRQSARRHRHRSNVKSRPRKKTVTGETEYRTQFKAWPVIARSSESSTATTQRKKVCHFAIRSPKKRSDITDPSLATPSPLPGPLDGPPRSLAWGTEYSTQYQSPLHFQYVRGAWVESPHPSPAHRVREVGKMVGKTNGTRDTVAEGEREPDEHQIVPQESLLAQLSEIRDKASQYRQRSEGSHFLPGHPSWTTAAETAPIEAHRSQSPSISVSSLSSEELNEENGVRSLQPHTLANGEAHIVDIEEEEEKEREQNSHSSYSGSEDEATTTEAQPTSSHRIVTPATERPTPTLSPFVPLPPERATEGRVPTPILQKSSKDLVRHHLDRTTPSTGGAVLTSPPPAFSKTTRSTVNPSSTLSTRENGEERVKTSHKGSGATAASSAKRSSGRSGKMVTRTQSGEGGENKKGLYLSQSTARFKRDPNLVGSAPRSTSHSHTLPKSSLTNNTRSHLTKLPKGTRHTLTTSHTHPSPPQSTISSLLGSIKSSSSGEPTSKKPDYSATSGKRRVTGTSVQPTQPRSTQHHNPHAGTACSSGNCDVCGAWMRSKSGHTGAQVLSNRASHTTAPLLGYGSHRYRGPVTQLAQEHTSRNFPFRPPQNGVGASNSRTCPPRRGAGVPETDPRPLRSFDELSISSLSISSCSVAASDLLRKAQERRDKFWTRHPNPPRT